MTAMFTFPVLCSYKDLELGVRGRLYLPPGGPHDYIHRHKAFR